MKDVHIHLCETAKKLKCVVNSRENIDYNIIVMSMWGFRTKNGHFHCPCSVSVEGFPETFCPCKDWVQKCKKGIAKSGDKCHCEVFVKV